MKKKPEKDKKTSSQPSVKSSKVKERDQKGRYAKGHKGGPGRPKGEPRDIICKDGKKRSTATLIDDLLAAYESLGGDKFLRQWASHSHRNLARFIEILFKFAPPPEASSMPGNVTYELSDKFLPKFTIERIYTDERPDEYGGTKMKMPRPGDVINKKIKDMEDKLKEKDREIQRLRGVFDVHGIDSEELVHEPIRAIELPEHSEDEIDEKIKALTKTKQDLERKVEEREK